MPIGDILQYIAVTAETLIPKTLFYYSKIANSSHQLLTSPLCGIKDWQVLQKWGKHSGLRATPKADPPEEMKG